MFLSIIPGIPGFNIPGLGRRTHSPVDDLDVALAGAQIGLEKKRQRWLLFLIEKEEECLSRIAQTAEIDLQEGSQEHQQEYPGAHPRDALTPDSTATTKPHDS